MRADGVNALYIGIHSMPLALPVACPPANAAQIALTKLGETK